MAKKKEELDAAKRICVASMQGMKEHDAIAIDDDEDGLLKKPRAPKDIQSNMISPDVIEMWTKAKLESAKVSEMKEANRKLAIKTLEKEKIRRHSSNFNENR
jgi:hypothetical protein